MMQPIPLSCSVGEGIPPFYYQAVKAAPDLGLDWPGDVTRVSKLWMVWLSLCSLLALACVTLARNEAISLHRGNAREMFWVFCG